MSKLIEAVKRNDLAEVLKLLAGEYNSPTLINEANTGWLALHLAARDNYISIIIALINAGAAVDEGDAYGRTPLHIATAAGHVNAMQALLRGGAKGESNDE